MSAVNLRWKRDAKYIIIYTQFGRLNLPCVHVQYNNSRTNYGQPCNQLRNLTKKIYILYINYTITLHGKMITVCKCYVSNIIIL